MSLNREAVTRIAHLARIALDESEKDAVLGQLNGILGLIDELSAVPTANVEPMAHAQELGQRLREDRVTEGDRRDAFLACAPQADHGLFLVPKVIE